MQVKNCTNWIELVKKAKVELDFFYESFGNCCTTIVTHNGVTIENEYTKNMSKDVKLSDMELILEKWLEFIKYRKNIEYSWKE